MTFSRARGVGSNASMDCLPFPNGIHTLIGATPVVFNRPEGATSLHVAYDGSAATNTLSLISGKWDAAVEATSVSAANNTWSAAFHGFITGDGPYFLSSDNTLPGGLDDLTPYWIYALDVNTIQFCLSYADATRTIKNTAGDPVAAPVVVDITSAGTGTHQVDSAFPAAKGSSDPELANVALILETDADLTQILVSFTAPPRFTAVCVGGTSRAQFWWS
jgi:hypothetical protein